MKFLSSVDNIKFKFSSLLSVEFVYSFHHCDILPIILLSLKLCLQNVAISLLECNWQHWKSLTLCICIFDVSSLIGHYTVVSFSHTTTFHRQGVQKIAVEFVLLQLIHLIICLHSTYYINNWERERVRHRTREKLWEFVNKKIHIGEGVDE